MRLPCKTKFEKAWIVTSVVILVIHRMLEASALDSYSPAHLLQIWLDVAMVVLSFPLGGLVMLILQEATLWCDACRGLEATLDWATLLFAGYIQWFWVLPEILRSRQLTLLNLRQPATIVLPEVARPDSEAPPVLTAKAESFPFPPAEFDEAGLTALDRVLRAEASAPTAR
jgi:hypothetical protein